MPKANSAAKQARASERKRIRNQGVKQRIRTGLRRLNDLFKTDPAKIVEQGRMVVSLLDRAAKTGVLHVNAARRHKARIMARLKTVAK
ncbi:MAG: 30S ribosomal protein S20 [Verrucomicrobia bacterium]|nr:30S ribosomal protein S20 [Verrucomicrobiota bacterium]